MKELHILFTGAGRRVELIQAFRQAALCLDKQLKIYGADADDTAPALAYCDFPRIICKMRDENYIPELLKICEKDGIDLVIPTIDTDLLALSENKEKIGAAGTKVMVSSLDKIRICRDKSQTSRFFTECGLNSPMTVDDWKEYKSSFPAFIKPKDGSSSVNAFKVENESELSYYAEQIGNYIVQPFISGREFTIDIFCDFHGRPVSIVPRERIAVRAGEVLKTRICMDPKIIMDMKLLIDAFRPCGPLTVQMIRNEKPKEDYYIEINPRFGGGAPLSMKAGARSAETILKLLSGEEVSGNMDYSDGAIYSRYDQSVCVNEGIHRENAAVSVAGGWPDFARKGFPYWIKGVIFDLDDTLYSEKEYVRSGYQAVAEFLGNEEAEEKLWFYFENGVCAIDEFLRHIGKEELKEQCLEIYRSHKPKINLYHGVKEVITGLKSRNIKIVMITDGRPEGQRNKIAALGLADLIDDIIITDELGGRQFRKPNDISFRIMQNRWRIPYGQIAYVGDNPVKDFQAAKQLGMNSVWIKNVDGLYQTED